MRTTLSSWLWRGQPSWWPGQLQGLMVSLDSADLAAGVGIGHCPAQCTMSTCLFITHHVVNPAVPLAVKTKAAVLGRCPRACTPSARIAPDAWKRREATWLAIGTG